MNRHKAQYARVKPAVPSNSTRRRPRRSLAWPQGRASNIQITPATVTAAPACQVARPRVRAIGPIKETNAIIAMVQAMLANSSGRRSKLFCAAASGAGWAGSCALFMAIQGLEASVALCRKWLADSIL
ncbi:hypothetical protein D3C84_957970 [compost metagenome]